MKYKEQIDKKDNKLLRITEAISKMKAGETISPTKLAKSIGIHHDTFCDTIDWFSSMKEIGFQEFRDDEGKIKFILRTNETLDLKKEIRDIKNMINDLNVKFEENGKK